MMPFDNYPGQGRMLLGHVSGANCRREYGLQFMRKTGQTTCAYCGIDFVSSYLTWLTMALDHVVPARVCDALGVAKEWREDCSNKTLACAACNGFKNRYKPTIALELPLTLEAFFNLRDHIFAERKQLIAARHVDEQAFYNRKPWQSTK